MYGLAVNRTMSVSGHPLIINKILLHLILNLTLIKILRFLKSKPKLKYLLFVLVFILSGKLWSLLVGREQESGFGCSLSEGQETD